MKYRLFRERTQPWWNLRRWVTETISQIMFLPFDFQDKFMYERPRLSYQKNLTAQWKDQYPYLYQLGQELEQNGVIILKNYFKGELLQEMIQDFNDWCKEKGLLDENGFLDFDGGKDENFLKSSKALSEAFCDELITLTVEYYWGKPVYWTYGHGYRLEPIEPKEYRAFRWHHDLKRKQVKVMLLLSDTPPDGQRMDYLPNTHKIWQRFSNHKHVRFSEEEVSQLLPHKINCCGDAGTVIIFDTNGIHRGNRNRGPIRDQYTCNFTGGKALFRIPGLHPEVIPHLDARRRTIFRVGEEK